MNSYADSLIGKIKDIFHPLEITEPEPPLGPPLDPTTQMIQDHILSLHPFASMSAKNRSQAVVAIQIPPWLVPSPYACNFREAAEATFGRAIGLETASSSAYTALGYEICRVSQKAFDCTGPGRLAVFEYNGQLAIASTLRTPVDIFDNLHTRYSTLASNNSVELAKWIDSFLDTFPPDMITLAGSDVERSVFQEALGLSNVPYEIVKSGYPVVEAGDILVKGAAQVAKDALENHNFDCSEDPECFEIRRKADEIAGKYKFPRPERWFSISFRNWREDLGYTIVDDGSAHYFSTHSQ
jgi:hypothetical protein